MTELQNLIAEANKYLEEIEVMHVELQHYSITITTLENTTEYLAEKKDELDQ
jgi:hypothetical protein